MNKILCAMSGGVDSAAAALLLKKDGYDVTGATMLLADNENDARDAARICDLIGIPHLTIDAKSDFQKYVKSDFCCEYLKGNTPNPCIVCNKYIKFGVFLDYALANGFDGIATGHYVRKSELDRRILIKCASDEKKDQSYMLWQLSEDQIERSLFPLGEMTKPEIREIAAAHGFFNSDRKDSQDICFVPDGEYAAFVKENTDWSPIPGDFLDAHGNVIGHHKDQLYYTIGQRKGLGMGFGEPMYVLSKNAEKNTVTLGRNEELFRAEVDIRDTNFIIPPSEDTPYYVKIRYAHKAAPARVYMLDGGRVKIVFDTPQRAPAAGQSAVIYKDSLLIGGGFII